jgi:hypothetical protein
LRRVNDHKQHRLTLKCELVACRGGERFVFSPCAPDRAVRLLRTLTMRVRNHEGFYSPLLCLQSSRIGCSCYSIVTILLWGIAVGCCTDIGFIPFGYGGGMLLLDSLPTLASDNVHVVGFMLTLCNTTVVALATTLETN